MCGVAVRGVAERVDARAAQMPEHVVRRAEFQGMCVVACHDGLEAVGDDGAPLGGAEQGERASGGLIDFVEVAAHEGAHQQGASVGEYARALCEEARGAVEPLDGRCRDYDVE